MVLRQVFSSWKSSWIILLIVLQLSRIESGLARRSGRTIREIYPEIEYENDRNEGQVSVCVVGDVIYGANEMVPADQPCLKCTCQPPRVQCETVKCAKKSGCKAIHRPNHCCPDYQCECLHENKIYANGEKLQTSPGDECKVCYCRGGEVQCTKVSCYVRTDCEAKTVPGQCCPKYDHCPLIEPPIARSRNSIVEVLELWPVNSTSVNSTEETFEKDNATTQEVKQTTIQEVIPEIKEIFNTAAPHPLVKEDTSANDLVVPDAEPDSSEISEIFERPPPVLKIGDKLLFLKQGELVSGADMKEPTSVITIIGAEGLQRGFEESAELHEANGLFNHTNDLEPKTSESTHILSLVKRKMKPNDATSRGTTELFEGPTATATTSPEESTDQNEELHDSQQFSEENETTTVSTNTWETESINLEETTTQSLNDSNISTVTEFEVGETTTQAIATKSSSEDAISSTEHERFMESIEETTEDSGEKTTTRNSHASIISDENASIEASEMGESVDMLQEDRDLTLDDVEMINQPAQSENPMTAMPKDVEEMQIDKKPTVPEDVEEIATDKRSIGKRENSRRDETDEIFRQLDFELTADVTERTQTAEEEKDESERIFKELIDETSTPRSSKKPDKDEEMLQRITDTIARLTLRGRKGPLDTNVLGLLSNFFGSRYGGRK